MKRGETRRKVEMRKSRALSPYLAQSETGKFTDLAEREGFEPPIRLPVCRISSAVRSTTLPPLQRLISSNRLARLRCRSGPSHEPLRWALYSTSQRRVEPGHATTTEASVNRR